jgi:hypothetical protein
VSLRFTWKEPLGAFVVAVVLTTSRPLRRSRTFHVTPLWRSIPNFAGADQVKARASGPHGITCEAAGVLTS